MIDVARRTKSVSKQHRSDPSGRVVRASQRLSRTLAVTRRRRGSQTHGGAAAEDFRDTLRAEELTEEPTEVVAEKEILVPQWIRNNASWWNDGKINDETFLQGIQFLIQEQIIDVPVEANVSVDPDTINTNIKFQEVEEKITEVPGWVKNSAGWWSDGLLSDVEFVNAIKFLVQNEVIKV